MKNKDVAKEFGEALDRAVEIWNRVMSSLNEPRNEEQDRCACEKIVADGCCKNVVCGQCPLSRLEETTDMRFWCNDFHNPIVPCELLAAQAWLKAHPKPKPEPEVFKVRITGCSGTKRYEHLIGKTISVQEDRNTSLYQVIANGTWVLREDCEIIPEYDHSKNRLLRKWGKDEEELDEGDLAYVVDGDDDWNPTHHVTGAKQEIGCIYIRPLNDSRGPVPEFDHSKYYLLDKDVMPEEGDKLYYARSWSNSANWRNKDRQAGYNYYIRPFTHTEKYAPHSRIKQCEDRLNELERRLDEV